MAATSEGKGRLKDSDLPETAYAATTAAATVLAMIPPPRHTSPSYSTADCPGVAAHCGWSNRSLNASPLTETSSHAASACRYRVFAPNRCPTLGSVPVHDAMSAVSSVDNMIKRVGKWWSPGNFDIPSMNEMVRGLQLVGEVEGNVDWEKVIDRSYLPNDLKA